MKCKNCGRVNRPGSTVCEKCHKPLIDEVSNQRDWNLDDQNEIDDEFDFIGEGFDEDIDDYDLNALESRFMQGVEDWNKTTEVVKHRKENSRTSNQSQSGRSAVERMDASNSVNNSDKNNSYVKPVQKPVDGKSKTGQQKRGQNEKDKKSGEVVKFSEIDKTQKPSLDAKAASSGKKSQNSQEYYKNGNQRRSYRNDPDYDFARERKDIDSVTSVEDVKTVDDLAQSGKNVNKKKTKSSKGGKSVSIALVIIAVLAIVLFAVWKNYSIEEPYDHNSVVTPSPNDPEYYYITVYANAGDVLVFEDSNGTRFEETVASKGSKTFNVHILSLLPCEPIDSATKEVTPIIYLKGADGSLERLDIPSIVVNVPEFSVTFDHEVELESTANETPDPDFESGQIIIDRDTIQCDQGAIKITGSVSKANTIVYFNGTEVPLGANNTFAFEAKYDEMGEYDIVFEAQVPGYQIVRRTFKAIVPEELTPYQIIVIPDDFETRVKSVDTEIEVYGTVPAGSSVSVTSNDPLFSLKSEPVVDGEGNFSFIVDLPTVRKNYEMTIVTTLPTGKIVERPFAVQRPPAYNEYIPTVWACIYEEMSDPRRFNAQSFKIMGTITEIFDVEDYVRAKLTLYSGETIIINYHNKYDGASVLEEGKGYTMYGSPTEFNDEGILEIFIWFVAD